MRKPSVGAKVGIEILHPHGEKFVTRITQKAAGRLIRVKDAPVRLDPEDRIRCTAGVGGLCQSRHFFHMFLRADMRYWLEQTRLNHGGKGTQTGVRESRQAGRAY